MGQDHKIYLNECIGSLSKQRKRVGRGIGSGRGGTSGAGHKGQSSRSGVTMKRRHAEFARRFPKVGFKSRTIKPEVLTLKMLEYHTKKFSMTNEILTTAHFAKFGVDISKGVKIIGNQIESALKLRVAHISAGAEAAVVAAGGLVERVN